MNQAYILLGTNMGDKSDNLKTAFSKIIRDCGSISIQSSLYETSSWGIEDQPSFFNKVVLLETPLNATNLLEKLLLIEKEMGRIREIKWGNRLIDLDILYFNDEIIVKENIKIPHPELHNRKFTLIPLAEIAPYYKHPVFNITTQQLLERCIDKGVVNKLTII